MFKGLMYMATMCCSSSVWAPTWSSENTFRKFFKRFLHPTGSYFVDAPSTYDNSFGVYF
jgi:hypothetical protein